MLDPPRKSAATHDPRRNGGFASNSAAEQRHDLTHGTKLIAVSHGEQEALALCQHIDPAHFRDAPPIEIELVCFVDQLERALIIPIARKLKRQTGLNSGQKSLL